MQLREWKFHVDPPSAWREEDDDEKSCRFVRDSGVTMCFFRVLDDDVLRHR